MSIMSNIAIKRIIENGAWQQMNNGKMVNAETGQIMSLIDWLSRSIVTW
jgi:hypothetical protein